MLAMRGSFITAALTLSRCARDLKTTHENQTTSSFLSFTLCGKEVHLPGFTSSPAHSRYSSAPWSSQIFPALRAIFAYSAACFLGTGTTKPST
jgi:hypothetical protein